MTEITDRDRAEARAERERVRRERWAEEAREEARKAKGTHSDEWEAGFIAGWMKMRGRADIEANDAAWDAGGMNW